MLKFTQPLVYLALSGAYAGACLGIEHTAVEAVTAVLYLLLALDCANGRH